MSTIAEHLGQDPKRIKYDAHELLPASGAIGIEIELENSETGNWPSVEGWDKKDDGSLRGGKEYVFAGPQSGARAIQSIENMHAAMKKVKPDPTFRCSTHIHLDVRDLDWVKYERLILAYMVFEDVFFDHCDRRRRSSNFCVPFMNNDWLSGRFGRQVIGRKAENHKFQGIGGWPKYSALNLQVGASFGSVEFRGSHAMTSKKELIGLAQRMLFLKQYVKDDASEDNYVFVNRLADVQLRDVFPKGLDEGYMMDAGSLATGLSTAIHALISAELQGVEEAWPAGLGAAPRPENAQQRQQRDMRAILTQERGKAWNENALRALNIGAPVQRPSILNAITLVDALNRLNGMNVTLRSVLNGVADVELLWLRDRIQFLNDQWGTRQTLNSLL